MNAHHPQCFLLTVDVEDWFHVENFKRCIPFSTWGNRELRVEHNVHRLLDLFDSITTGSGIRCPIKTIPNPLRTTFFVLGWVAERLPHLVREIACRGHEIASHGYFHTLVSEQTNAHLAADLRDSRKLLEDTIGSPVYGYRAPSFGVREDILDIIEECGYRYDSSYNSFGFHNRYGKLNLPHNGRGGIAVPIKSIYELPVSNLQLLPLFGKKSEIPTRRYPLPWGGGAYFRMMPFAVFKNGVRLILEMDQAYLFYMHPWEIDADQPRVKTASLLSKIRHYTRISRMEQKLAALIDEFKDCAFITCNRYVERCENGGFRYPNGRASENDQVQNRDAIPVEAAGISNHADVYLSNDLK
ncbi:MAG: DUF3473 domain-containing protein [Desulfobacterales bacterium]